MTLFAIFPARFFISSLQRRRSCYAGAMKL
jgi:hypothetical protein